jgi:hypothetical protein
VKRARRSEQTTMQQRRPGEASGRVAAGAGVIAAALAVAVPIMFGALWPGYSHVRHYISVLGARNAPHGDLANYLGFLPTGLATLIFIAALGPALPAATRARRARWFLAAFAAGYIGTAFLPCDPGCPAFGSISQCLHSLLAVCGYTGATVGLLMLASAFARDERWRSLATFTRMCAALIALGFALMLLPQFAPWRGLTQRVAETAMFGWIATVAIRAGRQT